MHILSIPYKGGNGIFTVERHDGNVLNKVIHCMTGFPAKILNLNLIMMKHQENPNLGTFYKIIMSKRVEKLVR